MSEPTYDPRSAEVQQIIATAMETIRKVCGKFLGQERDEAAREQYRAHMAEMLFESMPPVVDNPNMDKEWRTEAARAGAFVVEPFIFGMQEDYDPKFILHTLSDHALGLLEARFQDDLDHMPFTLIRYEALRRRGQIHRWDFKRTDETNAQVSFVPVEPAEFITVTLHLGESDGI